MAKHLDRLRDLLIADPRGLREIARASGLDAGRLSRFSHGREISSDAAEKLAKGLGYKIEVKKVKDGKATRRR